MSTKTYGAVLMLALSLGLIACGGGGGGGAPAAPAPGPPPADTQAPMASILFPPAMSISEGDMVRVRGTARDNVAVAAVRVNGVEATSRDGFANWEAVVPLTRGRNALVVEAVDTNTNRNPMAAQAAITRTVLLREASRLAIDSANNRALVVDAPMGSIIAVDLTTGARSLFSNWQASNDDIILALPFDIAIDAAGQRALAADPFGSDVLAFNLSTGVPSVLLASRAEDPMTPVALAIDAAGNRLFVLDDSLGAIRVFNMATATPLFTVPLATASPVVTAAQSIAYDAANDRVLVTTLLGVVAAVDLGNRSVSLLIQDSGFLGDIEVDTANRRALIVRNTSSPSTVGILAVDLVTGTGTVLSQQQSMDSFFTTLPGIAVDQANRRVLSTERGKGAILASDFGFTSRAPFADTTAPISINPLTSFGSDIARDTARNRLLVTDTLTNALVAIDLGDDSTTEIMRSLNDRSGNLFLTREPIPLVFDASRNRALVIDTNAGAVVAVDLGTGTRTVLSDARTPNSPGDFTEPLAIAADPSRDRLFVATGNSGTLFSINPVDGTRTAITSPFTLTLPAGLAVDTDNSRVLVSDLGAILAVNQNNGARSIILTDPFQPGLFVADFRGIALDRPRSRAIVVDRLRRELFALNLTTGTRTPLSNSLMPNGRNMFFDPAGLVLDQDRGIAFVGDAHRVRAVDLITGERVLL